MTVRHIPDEELHAYLDQALSRSQAVEIERHLARCPACQVRRDDIARLRDRTTELLAELGPPAIIPPAYAVLQARAAERVQGRQRWLIAGMWAASVAGAIFLGWSLKPGARRPDPATIAAAAPAAQPYDSAIVTEVASPARVPAIRSAPAAQEPERRLIRVPQSGGRRGLEPLCAAYGPACREAIEASLDAGDLRAIAFHARIGVGILPLSEVARFGDPEVLFFNVNTVDDLGRTDELWRRLESSPSSGGRTPERRP